MRASEGEKESEIVKGKEKLIMRSIFNNMNVKRAFPLQHNEFYSM